jgi:hypothetical protein
MDNAYMICFSEWVGSWEEDRKANQPKKVTKYARENAG